MTTYNTGNPLGSKDPRDLYDNAENFDTALNSPALTFVDRLGATKMTIAGFASAAGDPTLAIQAANDALDEANRAQSIADSVEADAASIALSASAQVIASIEDEVLRAEAAALAAENAADAAQLSAGVFPSTAAGLGATVNGEYFNVVSGIAAESFILYLNSAGSAVEQKRYPSSSAFVNLAPESIRDSISNRFLNPLGGVFNGGAGDTTGAFKISLPSGVSAHLISMEVTIADNYGSLKLLINGFNNVGGWNYTGVVSESTHAYLRSPTVRWGNDGITDCVWIGETSYNLWAYPQVWVNNVSIGGSGEPGYSGAWDVTLVSAFVGTVSSPKVASGAQLVGADATADTTRKRIFNPGGGTFAGGGADTTGALKIKLPVGAPATNMVIGLTIMDNYGLIRLRISGFNNAGAWAYTKAAIESDHQFQPAPSIRWGNDGTGDCIWVSDLAVNYWAYPQVWLTDVVVNNTASDWAASGWAISLVTSFNTVTAGPSIPIRGMPNVNPTFTGTLNGGNVNFPFSPGGTYLGYQAGALSPGAATYNTFVGYQCGSVATTGYNNAFGGFQTGKECTTGYANSGWGLQVLQNLTTGAFNSAYGIHAMLGLQSGIANVAVGGGCMQAMTAGSSNTAIGMYAGRDNQGSGNVFIGNRAGQAQTATDNKLHIANSEVADLIEGDFAANRVWVAGGADDGVNEFQINGSLRFKPDASSTPVNNGDLTFEATSNTSLKLKLKGSDGVVRSVTLTLS